MKKRQEADMRYSNERLAQCEAFLEVLSKQSANYSIQSIDFPDINPSSTRDIVGISYEILKRTP